MGNFTREEDRQIRGLRDGAVFPDTGFFLLTEVSWGETVRAAGVSFGFSVILLPFEGEGGKVGVVTVSVGTCSCLSKSWGNGMFSESKDRFPAVSWTKQLYSWLSNWTGCRFSYSITCSSTTSCICSSLFNWSSVSSSDGGTSTIVVLVTGGTETTSRSLAAKTWDEEDVTLDVDVDLGLTAGAFFRSPSFPPIFGLNCTLGRRSILACLW